MSLIVQKFGGTSVMNTKRLMNVASIVTATYDSGNNVVVVVSAQGHTTDELIDKALKLNARPSKREMDMLMSSGEQISIALLAIAIESMGYPVISFTGWQAGIHTDSSYSSAWITDIDTGRVKQELDQNKIVIVAGFQGINPQNDITTLGRGGSDTSAVALAATLGADRCQIYTDVDGVYTADPRKIPAAIRLDEISYDEMLELSSAGAQVMHNRSIEMARKHRVVIEVLSSLTNTSGTIIKAVTRPDKLLIKGVAKDDQLATVTLANVPDVPGTAYKIFSLLSAKGLNVDIILQGGGKQEVKDVTFAVASRDIDLALEAISSNLDEIGSRELSYDTDCCKISIVGAGLQSNPGIATKMFAALAEAGINIKIISSGEIRLAVILKRADGDRAIKAIHDAFYAECS